jgi:hypothetical protein
MTLRSLTVLLGYPSAELQAHIPDIRQALNTDNALPSAARRRLDPLLDSLETKDLLDLQADYSELFDRSRSLSLHLFEHVHGDSRERGQAMSTSASNISTVVSCSGASSCPPSCRSSSSSPPACRPRRRARCWASRPMSSPRYKNGW